MIFKRFHADVHPNPFIVFKEDGDTQSFVCTRWIFEFPTLNGAMEVWNRKFMKEIKETDPEFIRSLAVFGTAIMATLTEPIHECAKALGFVSSNREFKDLVSAKAIFCNGIPVRLGQAVFDFNPIDITPLKALIMRKGKQERVILIAPNHSTEV